jgi:tetratricopeptide (TPR) repeat protein
MTKHAQAGLALTTLLLLAGWAAWPAAEDPTPSPEEEREQQIISRFVTVLEKNPRRGTALDRIYGHHVERGSLDALIKQYAERTKKDATDGTGWLILGLLESQRGKGANAVTAQVADLVRSAGMTDEAIALYKRAVELAPDAAQYREYLGEYYHSLKRSAEALAT